MQLFDIGQDLNGIQNPIRQKHLFSLSIQPSADGTNFTPGNVRFQRLDYLLRLPRNQYPQICARRSASPAPEITVCFMLAITIAAMWNITRALQEREGRSSAAYFSQCSKRPSGTRGRSRTKLSQDCCASKAGFAATLRLSRPVLAMSAWASGYRERSSMPPPIPSSTVAGRLPFCRAGIAAMIGKIDEPGLPSWSIHVVVFAAFGSGGHIMKRLLVRRQCALLPSRPAAFRDHRTDPALEAG